MQTNRADSLLGLAVGSLREPRKCLRIVLDIVITMPELLQAAALVVSLSMILPLVALIMQPSDVQDAMMGFSINPFFAVLIQMVILIGAAAMIVGIGRIFNGYGTFKEALTAMVWLQFILIGIQFLQFSLGLLSPQLSAVIFILSMVVLIYLVVNFIMEIHGFTNTGAVIFGVVGSFFGIVLMIAMLLVAIGITPEAIQNV